LARHGARAGSTRAVRPTMAPPLLWGQRHDVALTTLRGLVSLATFDTFWTRRTYSEASDRDLALYQELTHETLSPRNEAVALVHMRGVAREPHLAIRHGDGTPVFASRITESRDGRFELTTPVWDTWLVLSNRERVPITYDARIATPKVKLDEVTIDLPGATGGGEYTLMNAIGRAYQLAFPPIAILVLGAYLARRGWRREVVILLAGMSGAILLRTLMLALIQVTSFDVFGRYESPGHALLILAVAITASETCRGWRGTRRPAASSAS
jgi:hypothetical protein